MNDKTKRSAWMRRAVAEAALRVRPEDRAAWLLDLDLYGAAFSDGDRHVPYEEGRAARDRRERGDTSPLPAIVRGDR